MVKYEPSSGFGLVLRVRFSNVIKALLPKISRKWPFILTCLVPEFLRCSAMILLNCFVSGRTYSDKWARAWTWNMPFVWSETALHNQKCLFYIHCTEENALIHCCIHHKRATAPAIERFVHHYGCTSVKEESSLSCSRDWQELLVTSQSRHLVT